MTPERQAIAEQFRRDHPFLNADQCAQALKDWPRNWDAS